MPVVVIDKIKQKNGNFKLMDAVDVEMASGKSVEEAFAEAGTAGRFTGNTGDTTPQEVMEALVAGKTILLNHTDSFFGIIFFANLTYATATNAVVASVAFEMDGKLYSASLMGMVESGIWSFSAAEIAKAEDIPEEKNTTAVDLSGYENGTVVETYSDGSTNTYSFEFDADGNPVKITDSDGNETVLTW